MRSWSLSISVIALVFISLVTTAQARPQPAVSAGTGWPVSPRHVVTNYHVVEGKPYIVLLTNDRRTVPAEIVLRDVINDLALLEVSEDDAFAYALPLASARPRIGSTVFTVGFPQVDIMGLSPKFTTGIVNAWTGVGDDPRTYQISVPIQPGNSGGPLVNLNGEVVGIVTSSLSAAKMFETKGTLPQNVNYAIKVSYLNALLDALPAGRPAPHIPKPDQSHRLEDLAEPVLRAVMLVVASDAPHQQQQAAVDQPDKPPAYPEKPRRPRPKSGNQKVVIFSYHGGLYNAMASEHEQSSRQLAEVMKDEITKNSAFSAEFDIQTGVVVKDQLFKLERESYLQGICKRNHADKIIIAHSEWVHGPPSRDGVVSAFDCYSSSFFTETYDINVDEQRDAFHFEQDFRKVLRRFLQEFSSALNWPLA